MPAFAPKALLHDHLDGGLRIETILELSEAIGWTPTTDNRPHRSSGVFTAGRCKRSPEVFATLNTRWRSCKTLPISNEWHLKPSKTSPTTGLSRRNTFRSGIARHAIRSFGRGDLRRLSTSRSLSPREGSSISANLIVCAMRTERRSVEVVNSLTVTALQRARLLPRPCRAETGWPPSLHVRRLRHRPQTSYQCDDSCK